jgi:hypothetical protein
MERCDQSYRDKHIDVVGFELCFHAERGKGSDHRYGMGQNREPTTCIVGMTCADHPTIRYDGT